MPIYEVNTGIKKHDGKGEILVLIVADSIVDARKRAWSGFRVGPKAVRRRMEPTLCPSCASRPCCCPR